MMNECEKVREQPSLEILEENIERTRHVSNEVYDTVITLLGELNMPINKSDECKAEFPSKNRFDTANSKINDILETLDLLHNNIRTIRDVIGSDNRPKVECTKPMKTMERV